MAIIVFVAGLCFWWFFTRPWDKHEEHMNMLQESKFRGQQLGGDEEKRLDDDDSTHAPVPATTAPPPQEIRE